MIDSIPFLCPRDPKFPVNRYFKNHPKAGIPGPGNMFPQNFLKPFIFQALRMNKEYENISFFLTACTEYGIDKNDLFQVKIDFQNVVVNVNGAAVKFTACYFTSLMLFTCLYLHIIQDG